MNPEGVPRAGSTASEPSGKPSQDLDTDIDDQHPVALDNSLFRPEATSALLYSENTCIWEKLSSSLKPLVSLVPQ